MADIKKYLGVDATSVEVYYFLFVYMSRREQVNSHKRDLSNVPPDGFIFNVTIAEEI